MTASLRPPGNSSPTHFVRSSVGTGNEMEGGMTEHTVESVGLNMRWVEHGAGDPVVFVHGIPTGPGLWRHVMPRLAGRRGLAWEMTGYGRSMAEGKGRDISLSGQADYLIRWMDAVELESTVLVGHDLGGGVAQIAAVRYPERVRGLVLVNAVCYDSWPIPSVKMLQALSPILARSPDAFVCLILMVLFFRGHDNFEQMKESLNVHWKPYAEVDASEAFVRQIRSMDVRDTLAIADGLPKLELPAAIVWGAADPFQKVQYGELLAMDLRAPLDRVYGGKHYVPEDHPDRVVAAVEAVIEQAGSAE